MTKEPSAKQESLAFALNLIFNFVLILIQSALLAIAGFGVLYWAGNPSAYFLVFLLSAAAPIGFAGIWYFYAKHKYKKMYLFYLLPLILFFSGYFLWIQLKDSIFQQLHQEEINRRAEENR